MPKVTKLIRRYWTSSDDDLSSCVQSIKLLSIQSTTHPVHYDTLDLYTEGATMSKFIQEGILTTTKRSFVALLSLTSHSTFYECSRSIICQPQHHPHSPSTRLGVIISYSLHLERKITSPSTSIISPYIYSEPSDETIRRLYSVPSKENYIDDF